MATSNDIISMLLCLDDMQKVQLYHKFQTGRQLNFEEIFMTFSDEQILDISDQFDTKLVIDFPSFTIEISKIYSELHANMSYQIPPTLHELGQLHEELLIAEAENEFVNKNSCNVCDAMPDCKKNKQ